MLSTHTHHWSGHRRDIARQPAQEMEAGHGLDSVGKDWLRSAAVLPFRIMLTAFWCAIDLMIISMLLIAPLVGLAFLFAGGVLAIATLIHFAGILLRVPGLF